MVRKFLMIGFLVALFPSLSFGNIVCSYQYVADEELQCLGTNKNIVMSFENLDEAQDYLTFYSRLKNCRVAGANVEITDTLTFDYNCMDANLHQQVEVPLHTRPNSAYIETSFSYRDLPLESMDTFIRNVIVKNPHIPYMAESDEANGFVDSLFPSENN